LPGKRISEGDLGNFLGMDRPATLPANRPNADTRPGLNPPLRPGADGKRPGISDPFKRPGINNSGNNVFGNRGNNIVNIRNINAGRNTVINRQPNWVQMNRTSIARVNNNWQAQIGGLRNWNARNPARAAYWGGWGNNVRGRWAGYRHHGNWFTASWWSSHRHTWCGWHYGYAFASRPWTYWWRTPTYANCVAWFGWESAAAWAQPVYYDYGQGGNVVYQDNSVAINGAQVATASEFAQSAGALATVAPPATAEQAEQSDWMPLGTFAVSSNQKDVDPNRVVQLAVNKQGIVSGTLFNTTTNQAQSI